MRRTRGGAISNVQGNTQGLKPNQLRRIEKLYSRRIPPQQVLTPEFARQLSELSHETRRQIGALIDRKGYVESVVVGDARRIEWPDLKRTRVGEGRFRGLRAVHTHLRGEELTQDDLNDLALLRLDLMVAVDVDDRTGLPGKVRGAHLLPTTAEQVSEDDLVAGHDAAYTFFRSRRTRLTTQRSRLKATRSSKRPSRRNSTLTSSNSSTRSKRRSRATAAPGDARARATAPSSSA